MECCRKYLEGKDEAITEDLKRQLELAGIAQREMDNFITEHCPDIMSVSMCAFREAPEAYLMSTNGCDANGALGMLANMIVMIYTWARPENEWTEAAREVAKKLAEKEENREAGNN